MNGYGYGRDVMRVVCDTVDSVKNIVEQVNILSFKVRFLIMRTAQGKNL